MSLKEIFTQVKEKRPQKLSQIVMEALQSAILQGAIKTGDVLSAEEIARSMEVSRMPVREAMRKLEDIGVVKISDGKGSVVKGLNRQEFKQLCAARKLIEPHVAALAAADHDDNQLKILKKLVSDAEKSLEMSDMRSFTLANYNFHLQCAQMGQNEYLKKIVDSLLLMTTLIWNVEVKNQERYSRSIEEHREILRAIEMRDALQAQKRTLDHLINNEEQTLKSIKE